MYVAPSKRLTLAGAREMMKTAMQIAERDRIPISVAIADAGGHPVMFERMDGGRFHTVHSSTTKAVSAASNMRPTTSKGAQGQTLDTMHAIGLALAAGPERWTAMEGGYPIIVDGECIGRHRRLRRNVGIRRPCRARSDRGDRRDLQDR